MALPRRTGSDFFEVDALPDRQALQEAPEAVESHLDRAEAHPLAAADDATAARLHGVRRRDRETDRAAELDAIGAVVEIDEHRERVGGARRPLRGARDGLRV